jgi:F0F1-type ATP synthase membrane subunit b/b'
LTTREEYDVEALGINLGYLIVQIIAFIVLYVFLTRWVYDPLSRALSERRARIAKGLEDAAAAARARQNAG